MSETTSEIFGGGRKSANDTTYNVVDNYDDFSRDISKHDITLDSDNEIEHDSNNDNQSQHLGDISCNIKYIT